MSDKIVRPLFVLILVLGSITIPAPQPAHAAGPWFVSTSGDDNNNCLTPTTPCATINGAIGKASSGDTINVATGTYTGSGPAVVSIGKSITLSGGWDTAFTTQSGVSTIDGQGIPDHQGIQTSDFADPDIVVGIDRFLVTNADNGIWNGVRTVLTISNSTVTANLSMGIFAIGGPGVTVTDSTVTENGRDGIGISGDTLVVNNSLISGNGESGVDYSGRFSPSLSVESSSISNNTGGGITVRGSVFSPTPVRIDNSTVANNSTGSFTTGGGIMLQDDFGINLTVNNSTIAGNSSTSGGGIYNNSSVNSVTITNTILANNNASTGPDCSGTINTSGHNIIGDISGCTVTAGTGDQFNVDPLLGTFLPAAGYYPLLIISPAIEAGDNATCLVTDQRGVTRPQGAVCDVGAYEYTTPGSAVSLSAVSGSGQRAATTSAFPRPLEVAALDGQGSPVSEVTIDFAAPDSGPGGTFAGTGTHLASATTDSSGIATSPTLTANNEAGSYEVTATASGLTDSVTFTLTNAAWYVAPTGSDSNSCESSASPCLTIQAAINKALDGETIFVASGTYGDPSEIVIINKNINLSGGWDSTFTGRSTPSSIDSQGSHIGILVDQATTTIEYFSIENGFSCSGGGILNFGSLILQNSTIRNNRTDSICGAGGGGIWSFGTLVVRNSTISSNTSHHGGGIYLSGGSADLLNTTLAENQSSNVGGGIFVESGTLTIRNSIVARNSATNSGPDCLGTIATSDHNIIGDISGCTVTAGTGDQFDVDPQLGAFLPAQGYYPLLPGSFAIDAGDTSSCLPADQRGAARVGVCDIGAYEFTAPGPAVNLSIVDGNHQRAATTATFPRLLKVAALDNQGSPVTGVTVTFTAPASEASGTFADTNTNITSAVTDEGGVATASVFTANDQAGAYAVIASASGLGSVDFSLEQIDRPAHDNFADALALPSPPVAANYDITFAGIEPGEPQACFTMDKTLWYSFMPVETTKVRVDTLGSDIDANVNIYAAGTGMTDLQFLGCAGPGSSADFLAEAGQTYYLQAGPTASGETGAVQVNLIAVPTITGRATDALTGAPLPGNAPPYASVTLQLVCGDGCLQFVGSQNADSEGRFLFDNYFGGPLPTGSYQIEVSANSYQTKQFGPFEFSGVNLDVGDLAIDPLPSIGSISGRLLDAATGKPVSSTFTPSVQLYRCTDGSCFEFVNSQIPDVQGGFRFETDEFGTPLPVGTYQIWASADQYQQTQTDPFSVGEGVHQTIGSLRITSFPVRFSDIQPCANMSPSGGECAFSVKVWNGLATKLKGKAWSMVNGSVPDSFISFTDFQVKDPQGLELDKGKNKTFRFRFNVPGSTSPAEAFLCPRVFVGQGNSLFNTVGFRDLFCVLRTAQGSSLASPQDARALAQTAITAEATGTETEPNNSCQTAQDVGVVSLPFVLDGNLDSSLEPDIDFYRFHGTPGVLVGIDHEGQATGKGSLADPLLGLFDSDCNLIAVNNDTNSANSRLEITIPSDGSFVLAATAYPDFGLIGGGNGSYQLTVAPVRLISSISGRITGIAGTPLRGDAEPFAFVRLLYCGEFGCFDVNGQATDSEGRFLFESDSNGAPLRVGTYQLLVTANQHREGQTEPFAVGEAEDHNIGDFALTSYPVFFSDIQPCSLPAGGGVCNFSVKITNGLSTRLSGKAWTIVNGAWLGSSADFTAFQGDTLRDVRLDPGKSTTLRFRFSVPGSVANGATICASAYVGRNPDAFFHPEGVSLLFCFTKGAGGITLMPAQDARAAWQQMQIPENAPPDPLTEKKK